MYGWHQYLTDPDGGVNCKLKLASINQPGSEQHRLLQCLPSDDDTHWTKQLLSLPTITFSTIYDFLSVTRFCLRKCNALRMLQTFEIGCY